MAGGDAPPLLFELLKKGGRWRAIVRAGSPIGPTSNGSVGRSFFSPHISTQRFYMRSSQASRDRSGFSPSFRSPISIVRWHFSWSALHSPRCSNSDQRRKGLGNLHPLPPIDEKINI